MAARRKNRRKLVVGGRRYLWWVAEAESAEWPVLEVLQGQDLRVLHVLSEDKRFIVRYDLQMSRTARPFIVVLGREFPGLARTDGGHVRLACPRWEDDGGPIAPRFVRRLIEWCLDEKKPLVRLDWTGAPPAGGRTKSPDLA